MEKPVHGIFASEAERSKAENANPFQLGRSRWLKVQTPQPRQTSSTATTSTAVPNLRKSPQYPPPPPSTTTSVTIAAKGELQKEGLDLTKDFPGVTDRQLSTAYRLYVQEHNSYSIGTILESLMNGDLSASGTWKNEENVNDS